jgi:hypothetical protein
VTPVWLGAGVTPLFIHHNSGENRVNTTAITAICVGIAAVITAISGLIIATRTLVHALAPILLELRKNTRITQESHVMINSQREAAEEQQRKTDNLLRSAGIPLPYNPAVHTQVSDTETE